MENKMPPGLFQPGGNDISAVLTPDMMARYTAGVNTPAPEDELDGIGGPDSIGGGY
jgi:hypothetical protein